MDVNLSMFQDFVRERRSDVDRLLEKVQYENEIVNGLEHLLENMQVLKDENERLEKQLADRDAQIDKHEAAMQKMEAERDKYKAEWAEVKMQLEELSKMSTKVVKKTEHEELLKELRKYMNISRRKSLVKRQYVKMMILEIAQSACLVLPDDMMEGLSIFDDEEAKQVTIDVNGDLLTDSSTKLVKVS